MEPGHIHDGTNKEIPCDIDIEDFKLFGRGIGID